MSVARTGGSTRTSGGAVVTSTGSTTTIQDCLFSNNTATFGAGALLIGGVLHVVNTTFTGHAVGNVGSVLNTAREAVTNITNCVFFNNKAGILATCTYTQTVVMST
jgi:hypothetical protein